jgi:hypothetical protein
MSSNHDGHASAGTAPATPSVPSDKPPIKPPSPKHCRNFIRRQTADAMPKIVETFVKKAEEGSVPHFTSLAKVGGFDQRKGAPETKKRKTRSLARQLLDEVERYEARLQAEKDAEAAQTGNQIDSQTDSPTGNRTDNWTDNPGPQEHS